MACEADCILEGFEDCTVKVLAGIETFTKEIVTTITVCWLEPVLDVVVETTKTGIGIFDDIDWRSLLRGFPIPGLPRDALVKKVVATLKPLEDAIKCLLNGNWDIDKLSDILPRDWRLNLLKEVPIAVRICVDHDCAIIMKDCLLDTAQNAGSLAASTIAGYFAPGVLAEAITSIVGQTVVSTSVAAIATAVGLSAKEVLLVVGAIAFSLALEAAIIAGQIALFEDGNGVCLHKSPIPMPVGSGAVFIPTIVTKR